MEDHRPSHRHPIEAKRVHAVMAGLAEGDRAVPPRPRDAMVVADGRRIALEAGPLDHAATTSKRRQAEPLKNCVLSQAQAATYSTINCDLREPARLLNAVAPRASAVGG